jgi:glycosyltransferase involved in cell wall biosynthesis
MRVTLIAAAVPPAWDGIGDYTACLAEELVGDCHGNAVTILTGDAVAPTARPIGGVTIQGAFNPEQPSSARRLVDAIAADRPDWVVLQYNPFSYGRRGFNLHLPRAMARVRERSPTTRVAIMFHETYVPVNTWRFAVMTTWQRWQFRQLGRAADVLFFSIDAWAERHRRWFPGKPIYHLPVGSNVPRIAIGAAEARERLGIEPDEVVLGVFGSAHVSRLFGTVAVAADAVRRAGGRPRVLYIGADGAAVRAALGDHPTAITDGPLPADEVSRRLSAVDLALSTYSDGVSTRRGAMMAALQHGLPVVGTHGINTDPELVAASGHALVLTAAGDDAAFASAVVRVAADRAERQRLQAEGLALYERRFAWPAIASLMMSHLAAPA